MPPAKHSLKTELPNINHDPLLLAFGDALLQEFIEALVEFADVDCADFPPHRERAGESVFSKMLGHVLEHVGPLLFVAAAKPFAALLSTSPSTFPAAPSVSTSASLFSHFFSPSYHHSQHLNHFEYELVNLPAAVAQIAKILKWTFGCFIPLSRRVEPENFLQSREHPKFSLTRIYRGYKLAQ